MTEEAVRKKLDKFVHTVAIQSLDELDPLNVLDVDVNISGDKIKSAMRDDIRQEMATVKARFQDQMGLAVDYSVAGNGSFESHRDEFIDVDVFYNTFRGNGERKEAFREDLTEYFERTSEGIKPLVESPEEEYWDAMVACYTKDEARDYLDAHFSRADIIERYKDDMVMEMELDTGLPIESMEYTDEAVRVFSVGEAEMRDRVHKQLDKVYDD